MPRTVRASLAFASRVINLCIGGKWPNTFCYRVARRWGARSSNNNNRFVGHCRTVVLIPGHHAIDSPMGARLLDHLIDQTDLMNAV